MVTWPTTLPQKPLADGYTSKRVGGYIQQQMDDGPPYQRPTGTSYEVVTCTYMLTWAQKAILDAFYQTDIANGTQRFTWPHPVSEANVTAMLDNSQGYSMTSTEAAYWNVTLTVMVLS